MRGRHAALWTMLNPIWNCGGTEHVVYLDATSGCNRLNTQFSLRESNYDAHRIRLIDGLNPHNACDCLPREGRIVAGP